MYCFSLFSSPSNEFFIMDNHEDVCSQEKLLDLFSTRYTAITSANVSSESEDAFCIHLCHDSNWGNIGISLSDNSVVVLTRDTLQHVVSFKPHGKPVTGLRFSPINSNLLVSCSLDGTAKIWDVRSNKCERKLETFSDDETESCLKPLTCFDLSLNDRILCAGTELIQDDVFLLFWDLRTGKSLGGYTECHSDDITQVQFHPVQQDTMASASTDGLVNIFDIGQSTEDDALMYSLNSDVTIDRMTWMKVNEKYERLAVITDIQSLQYWDIKEAAPLHSFSREQVTESMKRKSVDESYIVSVHMLHGSDNPMVLVGSGMETGNCLRTLQLDLSLGKLNPEGILQCKQEQLMTRAALYDDRADTFVTAGECGIVRVWKPENNSMITKQSVTKSKSHRKKPY